MNGHIYEDSPDARQGDDSTVTSRFRPRYRKLSTDEISLHDAIKAKAAELEALINQVDAGRYQSLSMTALEASVIWAVKQITT